jgi:hypothetical protein
MRPVLHANCPRGRLRRSVRTRCEVVRERDFKLVGTNVLDLSTRGMLLETDLSVLTGEDLIVSFESPTSGRWYDCGATVARVLHGRRRRDERRAVGVAFESLHVFDELLLCEDLRSVPMARRGLRTEPRRTW